MGVGDELKTFCETTSLKGIPRIFKTTRISLKILWILSVVGFLGIASTQSIYLLVQYLEHTTVSSTTESNIGQFWKNNKKVEFPDVTVCNMQSFKKNSDYRKLGIPSPTEYSKIVLELITCKSDCTNSTLSTLSMLRKELLTSFSYYQMIGKNNSRALGQQQEEFIVQCVLKQSDGLAQTLSPCGNTTIQMRTTPQYFNCYTFHIENSCKHNFDTGYSIILHLDSIDDSNHKNIFDTNFATAGGVLLWLHSPGSMSHLSYGMTHASPGTRTHVNYELSQMTRLGPPYGVCKEQTRYNTTYRKDECISLCIEKYVVDECGCLDAATLNLLSLIDNHTYNLPYCSAANIDVNVLLARINCMKKVRAQKITKCYNTCTASCYEVQYRTTISYAKWPMLNSDVETFYKKYIENRPYEQSYAPYNSVNKSQKLESLISNNFVNIQVELASPMITIMAETPKLSFAEFLSQIGGALNLWAGMTILFFVEVIELFIKILLDHCSGKMPESYREKNVLRAV